MGKKLSQATLRISKNHEKHQFNSLIKVLRPKVYITDSSSFKKLVQELTGNGTTSPLSPPSLESQVAEDLTAQDQRSQETGSEAMRDHRDLETNFEATANSDDLYYPALMSGEFDTIYQHLCREDELLEDCVASQPLDDDLFAYSDLGSLLFDAEADHFSSCYSYFQQEEVSIYDHELSGLL